MLKDLNSTWEDDEQRRGTGRYRDPEKLRIQEMNQGLVYSMWEGGIRDLNEIERETGYSQSYIRILLSRRGYSLSAANVRSQEEVHAICNDYTAGIAIKELLRRHGISNNTLYAILDAEAVPLRRSDPQSKGARQRFMDNAVQLYEEGIHVKDITVDTGVGAPALYQELANRQIPLRSYGYGNEPNPAMKQAIEMYKSGAKIADIELDTGIHSPSLYQELALLGIEGRRTNDTTSRINKAIEMYQQGVPGKDIYATTKVSSAMLYRAMRARGISKRNKKVTSVNVDVDKALELYDKGAPAQDIFRISGIGLQEFMSVLKQRGGSLRTGLGFQLSKKHLDLAIEGYQQGIDFETIEMDTLIGRVALLSALKQKRIPLKP